MKIEQQKEDGKAYKGARSDENIRTGDIAETVFKSWDYGHAFAYLWRRFGPPHDGWDGYKELAGYWLTTGTKGVLLYVSPKTSASVSFGYAVTKQLSFKLRLEWMYTTWQRWKGKDCKTPRADKIERALKQAMEELKRPVNVRDWLVNIEGQIDYFNNPVKPSKYAGYGITEDYFHKFKKFKRTEKP